MAGGKLAPVGLARWWGSSAWPVGCGIELTARRTTLMRIPACNTAGQRKWRQCALAAGRPHWAQNGEIIDGLDEISHSWARLENNRGHWLKAGNANVHQ